MTGVTDSAVRAALERVRSVPSVCRHFSVPLEETHRQYGIEQRLLEMLLDCGLPHHGSGQNLRLDPLDLENLGFALALPSPQRTVLLRWGRSLSAPMQNERGAYEIRLTWQCPDPGHTGDCRFHPGPPMTSLLPQEPSGSMVGLRSTFRVDPLHEVHDFGSALDPLIAEAATLDFHRLPEPLTGDLAFVRETRLADCRLANLHLTRLAGDLGLTVRPASGLFLGAPFPSRHVWFEVRVGDRWVAADPFFLHTLARWGVVRAEEWPLTHSPRNVLWRFETSNRVDTPLVRHGERTAPVGVVARWMPASPRQ